MIPLSPPLPVAFWEPAWGTVMVIGLLCLVALAVDLIRDLEDGED